MDAAWNVHVRGKKRSCPVANFGSHFRLRAAKKAKQNMKQVQSTKQQ